MKNRLQGMTAQEKAYRAKCAVLLFTLAAALIKIIFDVRQSYTSLAYPGATLYLLDYNFCYGSRTLIGSLFTLLTEHIGVNTIFAVNTAVFAASFLLMLGVYARKFITASLCNDNLLLFFSAIFFIACPFSVIQFAKWIGAYDLWLCLFAVLCFILMDKKYIRWLCPVLCAASVFTHYGFVFSFFPGVLAGLFYLSAKRKRLSDFVLTAVTLAVTFAAAVYCVFFAQSTVKMNEAELFSYMANRLGQEAGNRGYIEFYYFNDAGQIRNLARLAEKIVHRSFIGNYIAFVAPAAAIIILFWIKAIQKSENTLRKFACFLFIAAFAVACAVPFFIEEAPRWITAAVVSQILIFLLCQRQKDEAVSACLHDGNTRNGIIIGGLTVLYYLVSSFSIETGF